MCTKLAVERSKGVQAQYEVKSAAQRLQEKLQEKMSQVSQLQMAQVSIERQAEQLLQQQQNQQQLMAAQGQDEITQLHGELHSIQNMLEATLSQKATAESSASTATAEAMTLRSRLHGQEIDTQNVIHQGQAEIIALKNTLEATLCQQEGATQTATAASTDALSVRSQLKTVEEAAQIERARNGRMNEELHHKMLEAESAAAMGVNEGLQQASLISMLQQQLNELKTQLAAQVSQQQLCDADAQSTKIEYQKVFEKRLKDFESSMQKQQQLRQQQQQQLVEDYESKFRDLKTMIEAKTKLANDQQQEIGELQQELEDMQAYMSRGVEKVNRRESENDSAPDISAEGNLKPSLLPRTQPYYVGSDEEEEEEEEEQQ